MAISGYSVSAGDCHGPLGKRNDKKTSPMCHSERSGHRPRSRRIRFLFLGIYGSFDSGFAVAQDDNQGVLVIIRRGDCRIARNGAPICHREEGRSPDMAISGHSVSAGDCHGPCGPRNDKKGGPPLFYFPSSLSRGKRRCSASMESTVARSRWANSRAFMWPSIPVVR